MKTARITIEVELGDDWKSMVASECDMDQDEEDELSDKAAAAMARRVLQLEVRESSSLVNLTPLDPVTSTRSESKVKVLTFRIENKEKKE